MNVADCLDVPQNIIDSQHVGGCSFASVTDAVAGEGQMTGEIDIEAVVFSANPTDNPVSATFTCYIKVNGATQPGAVVTASGAVIVVGGGVITYTSNDVADFVQLCQDVSYSNGVNTSECFEADTFEIPPPIVWEVVDGIFEAIAPYEAAFWAIVDPAVCGVIGSQAGEYPVDDPENDEGIYINQHGDIWINGEGFFDCPDYGNVFGFPPNDN